MNENLNMNMNINVNLHKHEHGLECRKGRDMSMVSDMGMEMDLDGKRFQKLTILAL
jgi:hypothetical protein